VMFDPKENAGLDPLLGQLGLRALPGVLCSQRNSIPRTFSPADKARVFSNAYSAHPIVTTSSRHSNEVATVFVEGGALTRLEGRVLSPAPQITFPLRTTNEFWRDLDGDYEKDSNEPLEEMNMIAAITLRRGQGEEGRVVVIADGDFVTDQVIRNPGNMLVFVDSLRWLIGEEEISGDLSSEEDVAIEHTREEDKIWFYATSFAVPVPLLALGLWVAQRRRRRRAPTSTSGPKTPSAAPPAAAPPKSEPPAEGGKP